MKTKHNIENQIKSQLESREVPVSENAWERLEAMLEENGGKKSPKSTRKQRVWVGLAASVAILIGIVMGWNALNTEIPNDQNWVGTERKLPEIEMKQANIESNPIETKVQIELAENKNSESDKAISNSDNQPKSEAVLVKTEKVKSNDLQVETELEFEEKIIKDEPKLELKPEMVMALKTDSISKPKSKPNYVDPEMLLYSIENNQAVQEKNKGSKLVIIDFNK